MVIHIYERGSKMVLNSLQTNLQLINYPENEWFRPESLNMIIMESDNNIYFNPKLQKIKFDTVNELILLKYSTLIICNGLLNKFSYNINSNCISVNSPFGTVYYKKTIREPKIGDMIYAYDPVLKNYTGSKISNIVISGSVTYIYFEDSNLITKISITKNGMRFFVLPGDIDLVDDTIQISNPTELYIEKDITDYDADIFISIDRVAGFDFTKNWG